MKTGAKQDDKFHELSYYTLAHPDPSFIHQHIVDAYTAQYADENTKPIAIAFALVGLYLHIEQGYSGKNVQHVHMLLARRRKQWPTFTIPEQKPAMSVSDVLAVQAGPKRDQAIEGWCQAVWEVWSGSRERVRELIRTELP